MRLWAAPGGLHIAPATPEDAEAVARLHAESFYRGWPETDFQLYFSDPAATPAYLARDAGGAVAGFAIFRVAEREAELLTIAVERRWRNRGVGRALLAAAIADLSTRPVTALFLEVDETNLPALSLYRRFGFSPIGSRAGYYPRPDGRAATALVMRADLG